MARFISFAGSELLCFFLLCLCVMSSAQNSMPVTAMFDGLPVRGWLRVPPGVASANVVVLYHPTIEEDGVTPLDAAARFMLMATDASKLNIAGSNIVFACAYPQDAIPGWTAQQAQELFPGLVLDTFYLGDNIAYALAALEWAISSAGLGQFLQSQGLPKTSGVVSIMGHSQGAFLAHILATRTRVPGRVVSNAPGPIDLGAVCGAVAGTGRRGSAQCDKLAKAFGSPSVNPGAYLSRSLKAYLSNLSAPILYTQGLADASNQVDWMINIVQPSIKTCSNCASAMFKYYCNAGHGAFTDPKCASDIRSFLLFESQPKSSFDVNMPTPCPLPPWQIALIVVACIHFTAICVNIALLVKTKLFTPGRAGFAVLVPLFGWFVFLYFFRRQRSSADQKNFETL